MLIVHGCHRVFTRSWINYFCIRWQSCVSRCRSVTKSGFKCSPAERAERIVLGSTHTADLEHLPDRNVPKSFNGTNFVFSFKTYIITFSDDAPLVPHHAILCHTKQYHSMPCHTSPTPTNHTSCGTVTNRHISVLCISITCALS